MGNFYANIVVGDGDAERVVDSLGTLERRAYVARAGRHLIVFDEQCDTQDLEALEALADALSRHGPAFAVCNHDDDVLWYALATDGKTIDRYNSMPSYFDGGGDEPSGGNGALLADVFHVPRRGRAVDELLHRLHSNVGVEIDRHGELARLLDLPIASVGMGYRYVSRGEFPEAEEPLIRVGGAPPPGADQRSAQPASPAWSEFDATAARALMHGIAALLRSDIDVAPEFAPVLGTGRVNAALGLERLKAYIARHGLVETGPPPAIRGDAVIEHILGATRIPVAMLMQVFSERLRVPPLSPNEARALDSGDQEFCRAQTEALMRVTDELERDSLRGGPG